MQPGGELKVEDALRDLSMLLAEAYRRRARIRLIRPAEVPLPSTKALDNSAEPRVHVLTLTRQRKESPRS